ncbi:hypothetical protein [Pacificibacter marinus]|jgi:hypothetical protein|uniref:Uncharacterized protein n=1 Tax=Pacificibacter marinus TaxID=658057 RepID=A0A1Y5RKK1_9RHOB|nr:hypothetical protein [Pacificibacter marinus]SEK17780.1 hypothetical protein SAMN04488032_10185 [Pacificibacter marinus]SLN19688.1 hypothetical protein PAM7971_00565 [Pacificibacter marinus]
MKSHLKHLAIWLLDLVAGTPFAQAVKRNRDAAHALDAAVKEMLEQ